jgi:hypothetical protein
VADKAGDIKDRYQGQRRRHGRESNRQGRRRRRSRG